MFGDSVTLGHARRWLRERVEDGEECPVCKQLAKVYQRKIHVTMARALITPWRHDKRPEFTHGPSLPGDTHELSQLAWWGLVEEKRQVMRPDGGKAGFWRLTDRGEDFVMGRVSVPRYARVYDSRPLSLVGDPITIQDALGNKFNYNELMAGI